MERDWKALGRAFAAARRALTMTQEKAAAHLGVERATVQGIERGVPRSKPTPTMRSYARLVGWQDGSIESVLDGGEPTIAPDADTQPATTETAGDDDDLQLPALIKEELREGQVLAAGVYDLTPEGSTAQLIVVVKGPSDATAEDMRLFARAWRQKERRLRELESEEIDDDS